MRPPKLRMGRAFQRAAAIACLGACSCSALREIPRAQYAAAPQRRDVRIDTRDGRHLDFERVQVHADSLTGFERVETEGAFDETRPVPLALDDIARFAVRGVDWYRTGLVGGVGLAAILAVALTQAAKGKSSTNGGLCGDKPCPD